MTLDIAPAEIEIDGQGGTSRQCVPQRRRADGADRGGVETRNALLPAARDPIAAGRVGGENRDVIPPHLLQP